jgi:NTP pyrophosphatase (non-canonical NTP hydrolase)
MNFIEYQKLAHSTSLNTSINGDKIAYDVIGLVNESGELAGKVKKLYRDKNGQIDILVVDDIVKELGDILWYLSEIATHLEIPLDVIARKNIEKVLDRKERNVIHGDGCSR